MTRLMRLALRLYPRRWRRRYGDELEALLEDSQPGWQGVVDVARGAVAMQLRSTLVVLMLGTLAGTAIGGVLHVSSPLVYTASSSVDVTGSNLRLALWDPNYFPPDGEGRFTGILGRTMAIGDSKLTVTTFAWQASSAHAMNEWFLGRVVEAAEAYQDGPQPFSVRLTDLGNDSERSRGRGTILSGAVLGLLVGGTSLGVRRLAYTRRVRV